MGEKVAYWNILPRRMVKTSSLGVFKRDRDTNIVDLPWAGNASSIPL